MTSPDATISVPQDLLLPASTPSAGSRNAAPSGPGDPAHPGASAGLGASAGPGDAPGAGSPTGTGAPRVLRVCGTRRSLLRTAHDVGRAVGMSVVELDPGQLPAALGSGRRAGDVVLLDAESALAHARDSGGGVPLPPRQGTPAAVVAGYQGGADPWEAAAGLARLGLRADVVVLPAGRTWFADHLEASGPATPVRPLVGVMGACGGIGTSCTALWLGAALAERGETPVVVDAVEGSTGLDACLAPETRAGLRWEDLAALPHVPDGAHVLAGLPAPHGLPVLTASPAAPSAQLGSLRRGDVGAVLRAAATPVVDLGSCACAAEASVGQEWIPQASALVLLVPFTLRGLCQGRAAVARWSGQVPVHAVGVRSRLVDVSDEEVARTLGTPLVCTIPETRAVYEACETGHLLEAGFRKALRVPVSRILDAVLSDSALAGAGSGETVPTASRTGRGTGRTASQQFSALRGEVRTGARRDAEREPVFHGTGRTVRRGGRA